MIARQTPTRVTFSPPWRMRSYRLAASVALVLAHSGLAPAQPARTEIGVLTCGLAQREQAQGEADPTPLRRSRQMLCAFRPANGGAEEIYGGMLQSVGEEKQLSDQGVMIWVVKGMAGMAAPPGLLQQVYAADLAVNPGHAPPLIGETNVSIVLQTMADAQAPAGSAKQLAAAATIVLVTLTLQSTPA
jgi:hypothetical protein